MFGAIEVLVPLRMDDFGAGHGGIAAAFIVCAAFEAVLSPLSGRYSDRAGRRIPFVFGLGISALTMVVFAVAGSVSVVVASLLISAIGAAVCFTPALTMLSESAEEACLHQGFAAGLSNMAWASGQVVGGLIGGGAADVAGYAVPSLAIAALLAGVAIYATRCALPEPAASPSPG
jgi:MFS family permease